MLVRWDLLLPVRHRGNRVPEAPRAGCRRHRRRRENCRGYRSPVPCSCHTWAADSGPRAGGKRAAPRLLIGLPGRLPGPQLHALYILPCPSRVSDFSAGPDRCSNATQKPCSPLSSRCWGHSRGPVRTYTPPTAHRADSAEVVNGFGRTGCDTKYADVGLAEPIPVHSEHGRPSTFPSRALVSAPGN